MRIAKVVLAFSLTIIVVLAFVYFPRLKEKCDQVDFNDAAQVKFCLATTEGGSHLLHRSLSDIYPGAYWLAYLGLAASVSGMIYRRLRRTCSRVRTLFHIVMANLAIWYVMLPFTYDWLFWKQDGAAFPLVAGGLAGLPLSLGVAVLIHMIPYESSWYQTGHGFGPDNLAAIIVHVLFLLAAYIQWYLLVPAVRRWWRKKVNRPLEE